MEKATLRRVGGAEMHSDQEPNTRVAAHKQKGKHRHGGPHLEQGV